MTRENSDSFPISISQLKSYKKNDKSTKETKEAIIMPSTLPLSKKKINNPISAIQASAGPIVAPIAGPNRTITNIEPKTQSSAPSSAQSSVPSSAGSHSNDAGSKGQRSPFQNRATKLITKHPEEELIQDFTQYEVYLERNFPCVEKTFSDNLDILELHDFILKKFDFERETKSRLLLKQIEIEKQKLEETLYLIEIKIIQNDINEMEKELVYLHQNQKRNEYYKLTDEIFEFYNQIGYKKKIISFNNTKQNKKEDAINTKIRKFLIEKYLDIFKRYHEIHITHTQNLKTICSVCQTDLTKIISEEAGIVVCPKCNTEKTMLIHTSIVSEVKYMNSKDGYEDRENFWKALQRFQGKQNNHIPERLYKELDEYFKSFGLSIGKEICSHELTKKGTRGNTSRGMMFKALSETNNSVFYEDVNLICHLYWGWLLPDISADEEQIMNDYDMTQEVFKKIPKDRRSSLNAQYRLWQHLRIRGYRYPIEDFKIVKTPDILVEHDRIMKIMCDECNLPFISAL
jgi:hypothetical protein